MSKPLSKPAVIRKAIHAGIIPGGVDASRTSDATWVQGDFEITVMVDRGRIHGRTHLLEWGVNRRDLASIFATESVVVRGPVKAWQGLNNYPARLLQALVIARDMNDQPRIDDILEKLSADREIADREIPVNDELSMSFQDSVRGWAKRYSKALGFPIPLELSNQARNKR